MDRGVISLFGVRSELFVAMNGRGRLYGTVRTHTHTHTARCKMSSCGCCIRGFIGTVVLLICSDERGFHRGGSEESHGGMLQGKVAIPLCESTPLQI